MPTAHATVFKKLHSFCTTDCSDGKFPVGRLVVGANGNLYGTSATGEPNRSGHAFELAKQAHGWKLKVLYDFCVSGADDCSDGQTPAEFGLTYAGNSSGALYVVPQRYTAPRNGRGRIWVELFSG